MRLGNFLSSSAPSLHLSSDVMPDDGPFIVVPVLIIPDVLSMRMDFLKSTIKLLWCRKSAPSIARVTLATTNFHLKVRRNPRCSSTVLVPNEFIGVPFAAYREVCSLSEVMVEECVL